MKPAPFVHHAPRSVEEAVAVARYEVEDEADPGDVNEQPDRGAGERDADRLRDHHHQQALPAHGAEAVQQADQPREPRRRCSRQPRECAGGERGERHHQRQTSAARGGEEAIRNHAPDDPPHRRGQQRAAEQAAGERRRQVLAVGEEQHEERGHGDLRIGDERREPQQTHEGPVAQELPGHGLQTRPRLARRGARFDGRFAIQRAAHHRRHARHGRYQQYGVAPAEPLREPRQRRRSQRCAQHVAGLAQAHCGGAPLRRKPVQHAARADLVNGAIAKAAQPGQHRDRAERAGAAEQRKRNGHRQQARQQQPAAVETVRQHAGRRRHQRADHVEGRLHGAELGLADAELRHHERRQRPPQVRARRHGDLPGDEQRQHAPGVAPGHAQAAGQGSFDGSARRPSRRAYIGPDRMVLPWLRIQRTGASVLVAWLASFTGSSITRTARREPPPTMAQAGSPVQRPAPSTTSRA